MLKSPARPRGDWFQATSGAAELTTIERLPICNLLLYRESFLKSLFRAGSAVVTSRLERIIGSQSQSVQEASMVAGGVSAILQSGPVG
jgi:hypothetical protein